MQAEVIAADNRGVRARYLLRSYVLERISAQLAEQGSEALLVKGAALALTVYPMPWLREMTDVDLIVKTERKDQIMTILEQMGFTRHFVPGRLSYGAFGEVVFTLPVANQPVMVEVHTRLDKLVGRPVDYQGIFRRATAAPGLPGLLVPAPEDHVLLIVLHAAASEFDHTVAFVDLELLFRSGVDAELLVKRARRWRLRTALFVALMTLRSLGASSVPERLVEELEAWPLRRRALALYYNLGGFPVARRPLRLGWPWIIRQAPLRDDLTRWCSGVIGYAGRRSVEKILPQRWAR